MEILFNSLAKKNIFLDINGEKYSLERIENEIESLYNSVIKNKISLEIEGKKYNLEIIRNKMERLFLSLVKTIFLEISRNKYSVDEIKYTWENMFNLSERKQFKYKVQNVGNSTKRIVKKEFSTKKKTWTI